MFSLFSSHSLALPSLELVDLDKQIETSISVLNANHLCDSKLHLVVLGSNVDSFPFVICFFTATSHFPGDTVGWVYPAPTSHMLKYGVAGQTRYLSQTSLCDLLSHC